MATSSDLNKKKLCMGGSSCGVVLEHLNGVVLAVDRKQVYEEIEIVRNAKGKPIEQSKPHDHDPDSKIAVLGGRFGFTGVGWRQSVQKWLLDLKRKAKDKNSETYKVKDDFSIETCQETLEAYRVNNLANKENLETVEILMTGCDKENKITLYYFHNGGYTRIKSAYCTGKGANTAWMALVNQGIKTWNQEQAVGAAQRAIYDAHLCDGTTGEGIDVLVLYPDKHVKIPYVRMKDLKRLWGPRTIYMKTFNAGAGTSNTRELGDCDKLIGTTTAGLVVNKDATDKVFHLGEKENLQLPQGYTRAGYEYEVDFMRAQLDTYVKENRGSSDITKMPNYVLRRVLESSNQIPANHRGHLLIGGYNKGCDEPHLYYVNSGGVLDLTSVNDIVELQNRFQTGSGAGAAFVVLNKEYDPSMTEKEGISLAVRSVYNAIKNDKHTGKGIQYLVIRSNGDVFKGEMTIRQYEEEMMQ